MSWNQIVTSLLIFSFSSLLVFLPFKDFNIIKKESGLKFDGNQAFNKIFSLCFEEKKEYENPLTSKIQHLQNKINLLENKNSDLLEKINEMHTKIQKASDIISLDNKLLIGGVALVFFSFFITYKYLRLKKMHKNVINLSMHQLDTYKKMIELRTNFRIKGNELFDKITQNNQKFEEIKLKLQNEDQVKFDKNDFKTKIKNCCLNAFNKSSRNFQLGLNCHMNRDKIKNFSNKFDKLSLQCYNNLMKPMFFLSESTSNSVLLLSAITSFILINYIDSNFTNLLSQNITNSAGGEEVSIYLRSSKGYMYDFLKIEDYIWESNRDRTDLNFEINENFFKNKTTELDKAFDQKKTKLFENWDKKSKLLIKQ